MGENIERRILVGERMGCGLRTAYGPEYPQHRDTSTWFGKEQV
jgi:hypothetical protein